MASIKLTIKDPVGLHARPASILVQEANKFASDIELNYDGKTANLKSIMNVMGLSVKTGQEIEIVATGDDADAAVEAIKTAATTAELA